MIAFIQRSRALHSGVRAAVEADAPRSYYSRNEEDFP
jgi:hypothetical protein